MQPNYLRDARLKGSTGNDHCQTPPYAPTILFPYLNRNWTIWEPAAGQGWLARSLRAMGFKVITSRIEDGQDFYKYEPKEHWDCIVTNPPWSKKRPWIHRCYSFDKPFCLLYPTDAYGNSGFQRLFQFYGINILQPDSRIDYKMPVKGWEAAGAQMNSMWYTWKLGIDNEITRLCPLLKEKTLFKSLENKEDYFEHLRRKYGNATR